MDQVLFIQAIAPNTELQCIPSLLRIVPSQRRLDVLMPSDLSYIFSYLLEVNQRLALGLSFRECS